MAAIAYSRTEIMSRRSTWPKVLVLLLIAVAARPAWALVGGEVGNKRVTDPGWPEGAAAAFNVTARVAYYWADFGYWYSECRGDAEVFTQVLADFSLIKSERKRVIVHDWVGSSYWLTTFAKGPDPRVDWILLVPTPSEIRRKLHPGNEPIPQIEVYVGGNIKWDDVVIPDGVDVVDMRLESHGFKLSDGNVIEGTATDLTTGKPLAATMKLEDRAASYKTVRTVKCDEKGHWVVTSAPKGWHRIMY